MEGREASSRRENGEEQTESEGLRRGVATRTGAVSRGSSNVIGKHRLQAAISHLEQQIKIIQDELEETERISGPSTVCDELISGIESVPDPLLPMNRGATDPSWDRWFGGAHGSGRYRRWI